MPLPTSDFRQPVCVEMKTMNTETYSNYGDNTLAAYDSSTIVTVRSVEPANSRDGQRIGSENERPISDMKNDMGSIDSSDTYASCNTHPFPSEGDLTSDIADQSCAVVDFVLDSNLYINPLDLPSDDGSSVIRGLKKSASGDTALRSLIASPTENVFGNFGRASERGSRGSLNDSSVPKHRKTRFQQVGFLLSFNSF